MHTLEMDLGSQDEYETRVRRAIPKDGKGLQGVKVETPDISGTASQYLQ